jgi:3,4-dihydroxy-9,10-secoandrosta-1,3,5(10)-triene-9,17-dione 4,5-dioxygenase
MAGVTQLGYLGIGVRDIGEWHRYAEGVLGLNVAARDSDGTMLLGMDEQHHRFALHEDARDDVLYAGWQVDDASAVNAIAGRLTDAGVEVLDGSRDHAERRRVGGLIKFRDPDGNDCEVFHGPERATRPFQSAKGDTSFVAGPMGLGHVVFTTTNLKRMMTFYTDMLGMKVSDYVNMERVRLGFLHCNERHHSLAFVQVPSSPKRTNHFMLQLESIDPVGRTYDAVVEGAAPLLVTMGRHPNDEMVSFYMANPSNFGVEYGWGARTVDDSCWQVQEYDRPSLWGHKPPTMAGGRRQT